MSFDKNCIDNNSLPMEVNKKRGTQVIRWYEFSDFTELYRRIYSILFEELEV